MLVVLRTQVPVVEKGAIRINYSSKTNLPSFVKTELKTVGTELKCGYTFQMVLQNVHSLHTQNLTGFN